MDGLTISDIRARAVHAPLVRKIRTASGAIEVSPLLLVDVHTRQGVSGHAYLFGYTPVTLKPLLALLDELKPLLVGQPLVPQARMEQMLQRFRLLGVQGLLGMLLSTLDMAYWDALGKAAGLPVVQLLGGEARPVQAYDSYGLVDAENDAVALRRLALAGAVVFQFLFNQAGGPLLQFGTRAFFQLFVHGGRNDVRLDLHVAAPAAPLGQVNHTHHVVFGAQHAGLLARGDVVHQGLGRDIALAVFTAIGGHIGQCRRGCTQRNPVQRPQCSGQFECYCSGQNQISLQPKGIQLCERINVHGINRHTELPPNGTVGSLTRANPWI